MTTIQLNRVNFIQWQSLVLAMVNHDGHDPFFLSKNLYKADIFFNSFII